MPKKTFKRKARRRTRKGRKRTRKSRVIKGEMIMYNHQRWPLPPTLYTTFVSCIEGVIDASSAAEGAYVFRLNSLVFPYNTSVGTPLPNPLVYSTATLQPQGLSNICNTAGSNGLGFYNFYKVISVDVILKVKPVVIGDNMNVALTPFLDSNQPATHQQSLADPESINQDVGGAWGSRKYDLRKMYKIHRLFGLTSRQYMDDVSGQYSSSFSGSPTRFAHLQLSTQTADDFTNSSNVGYYVELRFNCKLWFGIGKLLAVS